MKSAERYIRIQRATNRSANVMSRFLEKRNFGAMKILEKTRKFFQFGIDPSDIYIGEYAGGPDYSVAGRVLKISRSAVKDNESAALEMAEQLIKENVRDSQDGKLVKVKNEKAEVTDQDWSEMIKLMIAPEKFQKSDFVVYNAWLCHNFVDRDRERFSKGILEDFQRTIIGKSLLEGHNHRGLGYGRFFSAEIVKIDKARAKEIIGEWTHVNFDAHLDKVIARDGGLFFLVAKYYILKEGREDIINDIDAGIISDMSIGFRAPDMNPVYDDDGESVLWWEYVNTGTRTGEAIEASHVFLGAQPGARTRTEAKSFKNNTASEPTKKDVIMERYNITIRIGEKVFNKTLINDPENADVLKGEIAAMQEEFQSEIKALLDEQKTVADELKALKTTLGSEYDTPETVGKVLTAIKQHKDEKVKEAVKFGNLIGIISDDTKEAYQATFEKMTIAEIEDRVSDYVKIYEKTNKPTGDVTQTQDGKNSEETKSEKYIPVPVSE